MLRMREVNRIARLLERTFSGQAYHGPSFRDVLEDVNVAMAARRPEGGAHSIWELVSHVTLELRYARALLEGSAKPWVAGRTTWSAQQAPSPEAWDQALNELEDANREFVGAVERLDDGVLGEHLSQVRCTYYVMLHGMVQHSAYHAGQIAILKRQLGPTGGNVDVG